MELDIINEIAVVILNYNCSNMTGKCYSNLRKISKNIKIVIVDNDSKLEEKEILKKIVPLESNVEVIFNNKNSGYAAGNNVGLRKICNEYQNIKYAFIMNPDVEVKSESVFCKLASHLRDNKDLAAITAMQILNNEYLFPNPGFWQEMDGFEIFFASSLLNIFVKYSGKYDKILVNENNLAYVDVVHGCFFGIKIEVLKNIDFLDEDTFLYCEEMILCKKIKKIKMKSGVAVDEFIYHNHQEKDEKCKDKKMKLWHLKCLLNSRKILNTKYGSGSKFKICLINFLLDMQYNVRYFINIFK